MRLRHKYWWESPHFKCQFSDGIQIQEIFKCGQPSRCRTCINHGEHSLSFFACINILYDRENYLKIHMKYVRNSNDSRIVVSGWQDSCLSVIIFSSYFIAFSPIIFIWSIYLLITWRITINSMFIFQAIAACRQMEATGYVETTSQNEEGVTDAFELCGLAALGNKPRFSSLVRRHAPHLKRHLHAPQHRSCIVM